MKKYIIINPRDIVAVALQELPEGLEIRTEEGPSFALREAIPRGHKFSLRTIEAGEPVIKYGMPIALAKEKIEQGRHVHTHNIKTGLGEILEYRYEPLAIEEPRREHRSFMGYKRPDGRTGVRNEIWIIPTVGCVNSIVQKLAETAKPLISGSLENIVAFPHPYGCSQMGDDQENTRKALAALAKHPNAAGVLLLGLGCENSHVDILKEYIGEIDPKRIRYMVCQQEKDEFARGLELLEELSDYAKSFEREPCDSSELVVGLKCGGSDGLSGITANPLVGYFSDYLIARGGTTILTEVPEMFGAEQLLMNRSENEEVYEKTVRLINNFKQYFIDNRQEIYENPSPGNKAGGISTLEDKSLGCIQKAGHAKVKDVLDYAEPAELKGLNLMNGPGNDLVSATALALAGAQIVLFTTGRGTPFASPVPTVKISSNTPLYEKKPGWIDFNAGRLLEEGTSPEALGEEFADFVFRVASGEKVRSEINGFHDMAIFKKGVTL